MQKIYIYIHNNAGKLKLFLLFQTINYGAKNDADDEMRRGRKKIKSGKWRKKKTVFM